MKPAGILAVIVFEGDFAPAAAVEEVTGGEPVRLTGYLSDARLDALNQGKLEQYSPPTEVYDAPQSLFVNTFVGTANTLAGKLVAVDGTATVALDIGTEIRTRAPAVPIAMGDRVTVCMRPEHLRLADSGEGLAPETALTLVRGAV